MINLNKNDKYTIPKMNGMTVGLGWDTEADLDVHADAYEKVNTNTVSKIFNKLLNKIDNSSNCHHIYFGNRYFKGIKLSPDNLTGEGDGDDETLTINFNKVPSSIIKIAISVNVYTSWKTFEDVKGAYIRLIDNKTNTVLCQYNLSNCSGKNTKFGDIIRENGVWIFVAK